MYDDGEADEDNNDDAGGWHGAFYVQIYFYLFTVGRIDLVVLLVDFDFFLHGIASEFQ